MPAPGSDALGAGVEEAARSASAMLLANHGPVVAAPTFLKAVFAAEELEETAKLFCLTMGMDVRLIPSDAVAALNRR